MRDVDNYIHHAMLRWHQLMHGEAGQEALRLTPSDETPEMVNRWGDRIERTDQIPAGPLANLQRINKLGMRTARINDDPGAGPIDAGRKRNHYKGFSRMGGSPQAPRGISGPVMDRMESRAENLAREGIQHAESRFGKGGR